MRGSSPLSGRCSAMAGAALALALPVFASGSAALGHGRHSLTLVLPDTGAELHLQLSDLAALPRTEFVTSTVWTEQEDLYTGVLLLDLLRHHGIDPAYGTGQVIVGALDGYSATIEFEMITPEAPMLAYHRNGAPMSPRAQGPFWMIFPYDLDAQYRTETIYAKSVWQVDSLRIER